MTKAVIDGGFQFTSASESNTVANAIKNLMEAEGYKIEDGDIMNAVYGCGSNLWRLFLGVFHKRYKIDIKITSADGQTTVKMLEDNFSKLSGGLIGYKKYKNEMERIGGLIEALQV